MNPFVQDQQQQNSDYEDCFFMKILRECSMEPQPISDVKKPHIFKSKKQDQKEQDKLAIEEFMNWKGIADQQEDTSAPQPKLIRAQSLRLEQERKISNFVNVFGKNEIDPSTGTLKTFSPQKRKKIMKVKK